MDTRTKRMMAGVGTAFLAVTLLTPAAAMAAGRGGGAGGGQGNGGGGSPGGGGGGEETAANNLSVPALFIGSNPFGLTCDGTSTDPSGTPLSGYTVDPTASFFVQGIHTWRAACTSGATETNVLAAWGDNLGGDAKLKVGSPIRVEMGLDAGALGMTGYTVVKLEPDQLDRVSPYGMRSDLAISKNTAFPETRVWSSDAHLKIYGTASGAVVYDGPATAEINATGRVVYGYNLRVPSAGTYVIEFSSPNVNMTSTNGDATISPDGNTVTKTIVVGTGGGSGGGKP